MFAYLGVVFPVLIGVDYFIDPLEENEAVANMYYKQVYGKVVYHVYTDSYHFISDYNFYSNTAIGDIITFHYTPIFNSVTNVMREAGDVLYKCNINNIYSGLLVFVGLNFVISIFVAIKTWGLIRKQKRIKFDLAVNLGIFNALLSMMTLVTILFQMSN